jgi:hypothetical protein
MSSADAGRIAPPLLLLLLAIAYYASTIDRGFSVADEGSYAQICLEMWLGRPPEELTLNYGVLWFKVGEALFHLFGPSLLAVRWVFAGAMVITVLCVYAAVRAFSGHRWFAFGMALVPLLVPAYPPTAFYGLCVTLNAAAQMRLACAEAPRRDAAFLAGVALAMSFQIRPDFGYVFAGCLALVLWLKRGPGFATAALAGFGTGWIPLVLLGLLGGYLDVIASQLLAYPAMLARYMGAGLAGLFTVADAGDLGGTLLQRPGLRALLSAGAPLAILIYLPALMMAGFAAMVMMRPRAHARAPAVVALFAGAAAWPHYFFYRPDFAHIANFMPGFSVFAAFVLWHVRGTVPPLVARTTAAVVIGLLAVFLWMGFSAQGTSAISLAKGRTAPFQTDYGVDVRLTPADEVLLRSIHDVIIGNTAPRDPIVCVPFCPGVAFMTGRQMFFSEFYVDDGTPLRDPQWLAAAIARTEQDRPPVVVVFDWAVNGTERSRFDVWAADYVGAVKALARDIVTVPGATIYLLPPRSG